LADVAYRERANSAARDFLRSAVVVDDDTYLGLPGPSEAAETDQDPTLADLPVIAIPEESATEAPAGRLDVAAVVRGFALMGIVCAALRPEPPGADDAPDAAVLKASEGADLIILDWALPRDDGVQAERLIRALAARPERGWLVIAVYTKSRRLEEIAAQVEDTVRSACGSAVRNGLVIKSKGLVVQILAKPIEDAATGRNAVTAEELPERLVSIFAEAAGGLLSTAALRGLTALRNETLGILQSFDPVADPGFVAHRLLLPRPADAEDHAVALLAAELSDVLESAGVGIEVDYDAVEAWVKSRGLASDADITPAKWGTVFSPFPVREIPSHPGCAQPRSERPKGEHHISQARKNRTQVSSQPLLLDSR
jgi:CheY-like chemotaxis protein